MRGGEAEGGAWWRFGAVFLVGLAVAVALAGVLSSVGRMGDLLSPGWPTLLAGVLGSGLAVVIARSPLALRLVPGAGLLILAGISATPLGIGGVGVGLALLAAPLLVWASRAGERDGVGLLLLPLFALALFAFISRLPASLARPAFTLAGLAFAGLVVAAASPLVTDRSMARFDLRAALAVAGLVVVGFAAALVAAKGSDLLTLPREYGGAGMRLSFVFLLLPLGFALLTIVLASFGLDPRIGAWRLVVGLGALALGPFVALGGSYAVVVGLVVLIPAGIVAVLLPALARLSRVREGVGPAALVLATLLGMSLAAGIVRAFSKPLPGRIGIPGGEVAATVSPAPVFLFYGALALVVLLAHLAFLYEFGLAALAPEEPTDRLPILRKGLQREKKTR